MSARETPTSSRRVVDAEVIAGARSAHRRLMATLVGLTDDQALSASLLPGWTRGHLLTHLARNADSHRRVLEGVRRGHPVDRYPGGPVQRNSEIEAGAGRPAPELVADVHASADALEALWDQVGDDVWAAPGTSMGRPEAVATLPWKRWREVEVHLVDLDLGVGFEDWSAEYVRRELANATMAWRAGHSLGLTTLPAAALAEPPNRRLAWLIGRLSLDGLEAVPPWF